MKVGQNGDKKKVLEELLELGMVLVAIDARAEGVDVPNHLGIDPQLRLNLSWRFGRPMEVDAWGIHAELTFGGVPYGCTFPWDAIFLIVSHINGESYLFPDHVPKELLHQAAGEHVEEEAAKASPKPSRARPKLSLVPAGTADEPETPAETPPAVAGRNLGSSTQETPHRSRARSKTAAQKREATREAAPEAAADAIDHADDGAAHTKTDTPHSAHTPAGQPGEADDASPEQPKKPARSRGHLRLIK